MKLAALLNQDFQDALVYLAKDRNISTALSWRIKKMIEKINAELKTYDDTLTAAREKNTDPETKIVDQAGFMKDYQELVNIEVEVPTLSFNDLQKSNLSAKDLTVLEPILTDLPS